MAKRGAKDGLDPDAERRAPCRPSERDGDGALVEDERRAERSGGGARSEAPSVDALALRVDALLADPLYWFPVRHHSPTVAHFLRRAILERRPKVVFVEGPPEADELVPYVVDKKTKPPVALYSMYRDDADVLGLAGVVSPAKDVPARFSAWYPLLPYSPEYVALAAAKEVGAEVQFIDLPHHALISLRRAELQPAGSKEAEGDDEAEGDEDGEEEPVADEAPETTLDADWERHAAESSYYQRLAEAAGYRSWDEGWDALFEGARRHPGSGMAQVEAFRRDLALFCGGVRMTTPRERMEQDGTFARERHMWRRVQAGLKARRLKPEQALVVTGGFHLFLDREDREPPPDPPAGTLYATVAPYSYFRVSEHAGYGAGNRAPLFYERLWGALERGAAEEPAQVQAMVDHVVAVLSRGRTACAAKDDEGEVAVRSDGLSSADAIAVTQHAHMLAALRGRGAPLLDDVRDALVTCCVKGSPSDEGSHLLRAMTAVEVGSAVGRVTPALGRLPLLHDFHATLDALALGELLGKEKRLDLTLDRREEQGARRSAFLHRLVHLEVPIGALQTTAGATGTLFREVWRLKWSPAIEEALVGRSLYGDDVETASVNLLEEELRKDEQHAGRTCERLVRSVVMDLPGLLVRLQAACGAALDADRRLGSLAQALTHLLVLDRQAAFKGLSREPIAELVTRAYGRACLSIPDASDVPEEEQAEVTDALKAIAEAVLGTQQDVALAPTIDRSLFAQQLRAAAAASSTPYLQGAFRGLLAELRDETPEQLAAHVSAFARARPETMIRAGEFLDGVLTVSRTSVLLGASALVAALDELLRAADWEAFTTMLPRLRLAFERLHDRQRDSIGDRVAERYGLKQGQPAGAGAGRHFTAVLETSAAAAAHLASIDARVAELMAGWEL